MAALTNYLESGLLNHIFRNNPYSPPSSLYIGLNKSFISGNIETGTVDEPASGDYARQTYLSNSSKWITPFSSGSTMVTHNTSAIEFPVATANIGNISGVFISDSLTSGNILFYGQLTSARNVREGDQFIFPSGALRVTLN